MLSHLDVVICPFVKHYVYVSCRLADQFLTQLPCCVHQLPVLLLRRTGQDNTHVDLRVRRDKVLGALQWLQPFLYQHYY